MNKKIIRSLALIALAFSVQQAAAQQGVPAPQGPPVEAMTLAPAKSPTKLTVTSSAFKADGKLPETYSQNGKNISPPLSWSKGPKETQSYVVMTEDMGGNRPDPTTHWVLYDIPASVTSLPEAAPTDAKPAKPAGALNALNQRKASGYMGPKPPMGVTHPYHFEVFALDTKLGLDPATADKKAVIAAMKDHVLAAGEITASYMTPQPDYDRHDLTGVWMQQGGGGIRAKDIAFTPEYAKLNQKRIDDNNAGLPYRHDQGACLPRGLVGTMTGGGFALDIYQRPDSVLVTKETPNNIYRIYLKRPQHKPADELVPMFYGDSIGHWEGNVLVVDSISLGGNDSLDDLIPHSDAMHVVQRLERVTYDTIQNQVTIEDPKAYAKPIVTTVTYKLHPDWELSEAMCTNERNVLNDKGEATVKGVGSVTRGATN
jgi:Raf kinase inhibitor-like YbhB/YbcL family protein